MAEPTAERPHMPGYGVAGPTEGTGLLPWSWAVQRLGAARYYWVCTVCPDGRPQVTPVWAIWRDELLWFSCSPGSRKARNLAAEPRCAVTTDDPRQPVVVEGVADRVRDRAAIEAMRAALAAKYDSAMELDFLLANATFAVRPRKVFGLAEADFTGSPTRWTVAER